MTHTQPQVSADIVIVGAGPIGLYTALRLARKGWSVHVVERWLQPYGLPRAVALDPESLRALQDVGLAEAMDSRAIREKWFDWRNGEGDILLRMASVVESPAGWLPMTFSQPELEELLQRAVDAEQLIRVTRGVEVVSPADIAEDADGVTVHTHVTGTADPGITVRGRYLIGADGANSVVRDRLGTAVTDLGFFYDWLVVDVIPTLERDWGDAGVQVCSTVRPTTYIGGGPGRRRWEFMLLPGETAEEMDRKEAAWRLLAEYDVDPSNAILERHAVYRFQARWAQEWNRDRILIVGDAAHQMPPFAGQGLNSGMRDAVNLTWKLDLVLAGSADASILDSYTSERSEHVRFAIQFSIELGKIICVLDPEEARLRDRRMIAAGARKEAALPPLPPDSFTVGVIQRLPDGTPQPLAGRPFPQHRVRGVGGESLLDDAVGLRAVLMLATGADVELPPELRSDFEALGGRVVQLLPSDASPAGSDIVEIEPSYTETLHRLDAIAALQRPDGYFFGFAPTADAAVDLVAQYVAQVRGYAAAPAAYSLS